MPHPLLFYIKLQTLSVIATCEFSIRTVNCIISESKEFGLNITKGGILMDYHGEVPVLHCQFRVNQIYIKSSLGHVKGKKKTSIERYN